MQTVMIAEQHRDLYNFLAEMADVSYNHLSEPKFANKSHNANSIVIWSQGSRSDLLDSSGKLEVIERHARKLGINIVLSAAANPALRQWGHEIGWTVMWEVPGLDRALNATFPIYQEELDEEEASLAC